MKKIIRLGSLDPTKKWRGGVHFPKGSEFIPSMGFVQPFNIFSY